MKLSKRRRRFWNFVIRELRRAFDPGVPVRVRTLPLKGVGGDCDGVIKLGRLVRIDIRIDSRRPWSQRLDTLFHEWAHAMEWEANWKDDSPKREHGPTMGVWWAAIHEHIMDKCWCELARRGLLTKAQLKAFPPAEYIWKDRL